MDEIEINEEDSLIIKQLKQEFNKKLQTIENYYLNIIHSMPNNVYWLNRQCITQGCNENVLKLIGLTSYDQFIGITYEKMSELAGWTEGQGLSFKRDDMQVMETGKSMIGVEEPPVYDDEGKPEYYMSSRVPIFDEQKNVVGVVGISTDITEIKNAQQQLIIEKDKAEAANKAKSAFLATISHELRTPLNGILGMAQILKDHEMPTLQAEYIDIIERSGKNLLALVNDILDLSLMESGNITLKANRFDYNEFLADILKNFQPLANAKSITLQANASIPTPTYVFADELRLRQVLLNLINNAIKFTEMGTITVTTRIVNIVDNKASFVINITDTGIGIPYDKINAIFERFTQVESNFDRRFEGAGLGLAIVKELVALMNGKISVSSTLGKGSTFTVELSLQLVKDMQVSNDSRTKEMRKTNQQWNIHILLVEDNLINQRVTVELLKGFGITTDVAGSGKEAILLYQQNSYDLVFMDLSLPDDDGITISKRLLDMDAKPKVPIVALTAHVLAEVKEQCLAAGLKDVINKPLMKDNLSKILDKWVKTTNRAL